MQDQNTDPVSTDENQGQAKESVPALFRPKRLIQIICGLSSVIYIIAIASAMYFDVGMGLHGYIAMGLGIFLTMGLGIGLMALLFYSARHGYDDDHHAAILDDDHSKNNDNAP